MNMPQGPGAPNTIPDPQTQPGPQAQHHPTGPHGAPTVQFVAQTPPPPKPARPKVFTTIWALGLVSIVGVVLGLSLDENGANAWHTVHAWGGVALLGAVLTLAPVLGHTFGLTPLRAGQVAVAGAGALVLYWVLFVLPVVGTNTSLLTTIGVAAGVVATWLAPGREPAAEADDPNAASQAHSW